LSSVNVTRKNIKLPADEYDKHNERRKEMGLTWPEYIDGQAPKLKPMIQEALREELRRFAEEREHE